MASGGATQAKQRGSLFAGPADIALPRLVLIVAVFFLSMIGLVMVFSSSSIEAITEGASPTSYVVRQAALLVASVVICALIALLIPYDRWLGVMLDIFWVLTLVLLILTALIGLVALGAQRWLSLGPVSFQPSELAKVSFLLMSARLMYQVRTNEIDSNRLLALIGIYIVFPLALLYLSQSDFGTTLICIVGMLSVFYLSGAPARLVLGVTIGVFIFGVIAIFTVGYRADRMAFLDPEADPYGAGYQLIRSYYAFGEGGLLGVGLGNSSEKYLYLPEANTDFIFAILAEEMGFVGALLVIIAYLAILWAGLRIARNAPDLFGSMVAGGATSMLVFQAFLNIGCVAGVLPTTGKPLPFISSGGTALLGSFILVGIILSVSLASEGSDSVYSRRRDNLRVVKSSSGKSSASSKGKKSSRSSARR